MAQLLNPSTHATLITGASRGIGRAIALKFAAEGYPVIINARNTQPLLQLKNEIIEQYQVPCLAIAGDVSDPEFVKKMFQIITKEFGGVSILINNAGIAYSGLLSDMSVEEWHTILNTNLSSCFYCSRQALSYMLQKKQGKIINISSVWGICGASYEVAYCASKGGMNTFTKALAKELAPSNIQVNAIACGCIDTAMNAGYTLEERAQLEEEIPAGKFAQPEEVAQFAFDLARSSNYLTGQVIQLDGGWI